MLAGTSEGERNEAPFVHWFKVPGRIVLISISSNVIEKPLNKNFISGKDSYLK